MTTIIFDCDPGLDDAIALWMVLSSGCDVRLVTTCSGNQVGNKTFTNARNIVALAKRGDIPVVSGAQTPMVAPVVIADYVHGDDGLGGVELPASAAPIDRRRAIEAMRDVVEVSAEPVIIAATGPATNVAVFLLAYPDLRPRIERIVWMGGSVGLGNHTAAAEFNAFVDPHAADVMFRSGVPISMFGLNVTTQAQAFPDDIAAIDGLGNPVARASAAMLRYYQDTITQPIIAEPGHMEGVHLHDPCVSAFLCQPDLFTMVPACVSLITAEGAAYGATIADFNASPNCEVAIAVDRERFIEFVTGQLARY